MMKVEKSQVTKLLLTELDKLDPVTVYLEDYEKGKGKITIECWSESWTSYWGAMGDNNISSFFCSCDDYYLTKNLTNIDSEIPDIDRICSEISMAIGEEYYDDNVMSDHVVLAKAYGDEWFHHDFPTKPNPQHQYLCRIIKAVQEGLKQ